MKLLKYCYRGMLVAASTLLVSNTNAQTVANGRITNDSSTHSFNFSGEFIVSFFYTTIQVGGAGSGVVPVRASGTLAPLEARDFNSTFVGPVANAATIRASVLGQGAVVSSVVTGSLFNYSSQSHTQLQAVPPTSNSASIIYSPGATWIPAYIGGSGGSENLFSIAGVTHWQTSPWSVTPSPGTYTFYVASRPQPGHSGNATDPIQGNLAVNFTPYALTVSVPAVAPTSQNTTARVGVAFTPSFSGGLGGEILWTVAGATNWQAGAWVPTASGTYSFYVGVKVSNGYLGNATDPIQGAMQVNPTAYTVTVN